MIALSPAETTEKALNPSAQKYFPLHQNKIPVGAPKQLLPPPHLKFLPSPFYSIPPPPPSLQYYLSGRLFQPMPELLLPHQIVWKPVMTHAGLPHTVLTGSGKSTAPVAVKNPPGNSGNQAVFFDSQPKKQRPATYRPFPTVSQRAVPPRLQVYRRKCGKLAPPLEISDYPLGSSTTVMVRNIPNRLRQTELVNLLAEHCLEVNKSAACKSEFDLVYLPVDFWRLGNKGYAFVNFTTAAGAASLNHAWNNLGWKKFDTKKTRLITTAAIQGKARLKAHLERSTFDCDTDAYLAVEFTPPCDGSNLSTVSAATVGSRVKSVQN